MSGNNNGLGLSSLDEEVIILEADYRLKNTIGVPLSAVFTPERIKAAERIIVEKAGEFIAKCTDDAVKMKKLFIMIQNERDLKSEIFQELKEAALRIKSFAGLAGFPLSTEIARSLYTLLDRMKGFDDKTLSVVGFHVDSIFAIFSEGRRDVQDAIAQQVIVELKKVSQKV